MLAGSLILTACSRYSFVLNDNLLYSPPQLYLVEELTDVALRKCVQQHVDDQEIYAAEELQQLVCSSAGVVSLEGLERFSRIEQLDLGNNRLTDISALFMLANLEYVDLTENDQLSCEELNRLKTLVNSTSQFPQQCTADNP